MRVLCKAVSRCNHVNADTVGLLHFLVGNKEKCKKLKILLQTCYVEGRRRHQIGATAAAAAHVVQLCGSRLTEDVQR